MRHVGTAVVCRSPDAQAELVLPGDAHLERGRRGQALRHVSQTGAVIRFSERAGHARGMLSHHVDIIVCVPAYQTLSSDDSMKRKRESEVYRVEALIYLYECTDEDSECVGWKYVGQTRDSIEVQHRSHLNQSSKFDKVTRTGSGSTVN